MSEFKENLRFRTELNRELKNYEVDLNFKYVANPWNPDRIYEKGMIIYHTITDNSTSKTKTTHWFIATKRTTKGIFSFLEWDIIGGSEGSIINTSENSFSKFIINSTEIGLFSSDKNGIISAETPNDQINFEAGDGISLEFDNTKNIIKISRGIGGGESNTANNLGAGLELFKDKIDGVLNFRTIYSNNEFLKINYDGDTIKFDCVYDKINLNNLGIKLLSDLDNISNISPTLNQVLSWNGIEWVPSTITNNIYTATNLGTGSYDIFSNITLNDFKFRKLATTANGPITISQSANYLTFNWDGSKISIEDIGNVNITNLQNGQSLTYNNVTSKWENTNNINDIISIGSGIPIFREAVSGKVQFSSLLSANNLINITELTDGSIELEFNRNLINEGLWKENTDNSIYYDNNYVGINNNSPEEWLHVNGNALINNNLYVGTTINDINFKDFNIINGTTYSWPLTNSGNNIIHNINTAIQTTELDILLLNGNYNSGNAKGVNLTLKGAELHNIGNYFNIGNSIDFEPPHPQPYLGIIPYNYNAGFDILVGPELNTGNFANTIYGGIIRLGDTTRGAHNNVGLYIDASGNETRGEVLALHTKTGKIKIEDLLSTSTNSNQNLVVVAPDGTLESISQSSVGGNINLYSVDGVLSSNRIVDLNSNFIQFSDSSISTGVEPFMHIEAAPGFLKFIGNGPIPGFLDHSYSGDIALYNDEIFINGIYNDNGNDEFVNLLMSIKQGVICGISSNVTDISTAYIDNNSGYTKTITVSDYGINFSILDTNGLIQSTIDRYGNFGINTSSPEHQLHVVNDKTGQDAAYFEGDVTIDGKLNVTGLIDPTGLVLNEQIQAPHTNSTDEGLLWVGNNTEGQTVYFTDKNGTDYDLVKSGLPDNLISEHYTNYRYESYDSNGVAVGPNKVKRSKFLLNIPDGTTSQKTTNIVTTPILEVVNYRVMARHKTELSYTFIVTEAVYDLGAGSSKAKWRTGDNILEYATNFVEGSSNHSIVLNSDRGIDFDSMYECYLVFEYTVS